MLLLSYNVFAPLQSVNFSGGSMNIAKSKSEHKSEKGN